MEGAADATGFDWREAPLAPGIVSSSHGGPGRRRGAAARQETSQLIDFTYVLTLIASR